MRPSILICSIFIWLMWSILCPCHTLLAADEPEALAIAHTSLPVKEVIIGISNLHKKKLRQHSIYPPYDRLLGMPIKKWLYLWGKNHYNPKKIEKDILHLTYTFQEKLTKASSERAKEKLTAAYHKRMKEKNNRLKYGNQLMRIGEKPRYYHPNGVTYNKKVFLNYMQSHGYLDAEITSKTTFYPDKACITYYITPKKRYKINGVTLEVSDLTIKNLLRSHEKESYLKTGKVYHYEDFINEQERIITLLSNHGYFNFSEQCVHFTAEVSQEQATIAITTVVDQAPSGLDHMKTKVAQVIVYLSDQPIEQENQPDLLTKTCDDIRFIFQSGSYPLPQLARKIAIRPGDFYNKSKIIETYEQLHFTSIFESITILPKLETDGLVIYIHAKPHARISFQTALGGECFDLKLTKLRPTIKLTPTIRRLFGKLNVAHIEGSIAWREEPQQEDANKFYKNISYKLEMKYTTPQFMLFLPKKLHQRLERFGPHTTISIGYNFIKHHASTQEKIDAILQYNWQNQSKKILYGFTPCKIECTHLISDTNKERSESQPSSFLTTIIYSSTINNTTNNKPYFTRFTRQQWLLSIDVELGGSYEHLFRLTKLLPKHFQCYKYLKLDLGYKHTFNLTQRTLLVYQTKWGILKNFLTIPVPDKQYQMGGYSSIRAWDTGTIGPGLYEPKNEHARRKGDLLLLGNIELRQKLIGYLEGAVFLDAGNSWDISKDSQIIKRFYFNNFYKSLAIGGGVGARLNFNNIFVLCLDVATKLRYPTGIKTDQSKQVIYTLSMGYPF
ncbi:MAG: BamA/TamA family outer membrane protein [Amoebophilaceae bacterium]|nr:BamA/TamA family outer membrane protein [Amoebophilaceae bacterium]